MPQPILHVKVTEELKEKLSEEALSLGFKSEDNSVNWNQFLSYKLEKDSKPIQNLKQTKEELQVEKLRLECALLRCKVESAKYQNGIAEREQETFNQDSDRALESRVLKEKFEKQIVNDYFIVDSENSCYKCNCGSVSFSTQGAVKHFENNHADILAEIKKRSA